MIKGPELRLKAIAPRMAQKTLRELRKEKFNSNSSQNDFECPHFDGRFKA
jgi:hypothetical protein